MSIERISVEGKEIILVGTAHVSRESAELARKTIIEEKPEVVGIELDFPRFAQLLYGPQWESQDPEELMQGNRPYMFLLTLWLEGIQKRIGDELGVKPGSEMLEAFRSAQESGIPVALLDRDIRITMGRALALSSAAEKARLMLELIASGIFGLGEKITPQKIEEMKRQDIMTSLMNELARKAPGIKKVLVDERDEFIAARILSLEAKKIVAVVGAGHLAGIKKHLASKHHEIWKISYVPKKHSVLGFMPWIFPILLCGLIAFGISFHGIIFLPQALGVWIVSVGLLSALCAMLAKGHFLSAASAFLSAPIAVAFPITPAGRAAAVTEAGIKRPQESAKDYLKRTAKVSAFAGIGAVIGAIIGLALIFASL